MPQRLSIGATVFLVLTVLVGLYFAYAAVQGPSGILRRIQIQAETEDLREARDLLQADVTRMQNLTRRLSDEYLDLDLLDERAREVLGLLASGWLLAASGWPSAWASAMHERRGIEAKSPGPSPMRIISGWYCWTTWRKFAFWNGVGSTSVGSRPLTVRFN